MKAFFEAIAYLFKKSYLSLNLLRELELTSWFLANGINGVFGDWVCRNDLLDWPTQKFNDSGEEDTDSTSHSFL